jgi:hypothetical protein
LLFESVLQLEVEVHRFLLDLGREVALLGVLVFRGDAALGFLESLGLKLRR